MESMKKLTKNTTLISSLKVNDIGSQKLHERHEVAVVSINNSRMGRAIVLDQHLIDRLYKQKYIDEQEHLVADRYLNMIAKSISTSSVCMMLQKGFSPTAYTYTVPRSVMLVGVQRKLRKDIGNEQERMFWKIMINNPKHISEDILELIKDACESLQAYWYVGVNSPVSLLEQAIQDH